MANDFARGQVIGTATGLIMLVSGIPFTVQNILIASIPAAIVGHLTKNNKRDEEVSETLTKEVLIYQGYVNRGDMEGLSDYLDSLDEETRSILCDYIEKHAYFINNERIS